MRNNRSLLSSTRAFLRLSVILCVAAASTAQGGTKTVTTVAGGYLGEGKPATLASLATPIGVARDAKGRLYISDSNNCRIRRIGFNGLIRTFAGTGICGYSGDGGPATSAQMGSPTGLAFDRYGNLFFADQGNSRIRKITPTGKITTVAGNGTRGYSGDGSSATEAALYEPEGVFVDSSGNIYIADTTNFVIRMVDTSGIIHTIAGNHTYGFSGDGGPATSAQMIYPYSVVADGAGNIYISDSANHRIRKVDSSGTITTYAGNGLAGNEGNGGAATGASIGIVQGLLLARGKLYISTNSNIWSVNQSTQIITLVAGNGNAATGFSGDGNPALSTSFFNPWGMAIDGRGNLLVADSGNGRVREIDSDQTVTTIAGGYVGDGGPATAASLNQSLPGSHPAIDTAGNLYIPDTNNNRVRKISPNGTITTVAGTGITGYSGDGGPATAASLNAPAAVAIDSAGNVIIADNGNGAIRKVDASGTITTFVSSVTVPAPWGGTISLSVNAYGLAFDGSGNLYVANSGNDVVLKIAPDGTGSIVAGGLWQYGYSGDGAPATKAQLFLPTGVALDGAGNLYIADWENSRIRKVDANGIITTVAGTGIWGFTGDGGPATAAQLFLPTDVAIDSKGNLYISDSINFRVRVVNPSGTIRTLAGTGAGGYNGNNLPATNTNMLPNGILVGPAGNVYITDLGTQRVRKIH